MNDYANLSVEMVHHYNRAGPRYTSYPTVPVWEKGAFAEDYVRFLQKEGKKETPLSLYIHIPFCSRLCTFCGCNQFITTNQDLVQEYLEAIEAELEQTARHLGARKTIKQFHLGGGTPTHLRVEQLLQLHQMVSKYFDFAPEGEMALEAHPRVTQTEQLAALYELGFRRLSLGVQDLDAKVQYAINREQTLEQTQQTFYKARQLGYTSINIDLVYGLPCQTLKTFQTTLAQVDEMKPDRLAIYSFAYIPNMFRTHERAIREDNLPATEEKIAIYMTSIQFFVEAGYQMIGMDHYAQPNDELALAQKNHTLHRNFMGYTTLRGLSQIGIGVSAISDFGHGYFQNEKDLQTYMQAIRQGTIATIRKRELDSDDLLRRETIETLMCQCHLPISALEEAHQFNFREYFKQEWEAMKLFEKEGLLELQPHQLKLTPLGVLFMRNIAMPFDRYLKSNTPHFSKTV